MPYVFVLLAFLADRLTKLWVVANLAENETIRLHAYLSLHVIYNRGIAFGMFQGIGQLVGWLSILVVLGMFIYMARLPKSMRLMRLGLGIMIGGALGNLVDRVLVGEVLDFIQTPLRSGIFNVADMMIHLGVITTMIALVSYRSKERSDADLPEIDHSLPPSPDSSQS